MQIIEVEVGQKVCQRGSQKVYIIAELIDL
jgi:hypothetical protein